MRDAAGNAAAPAARCKNLRRGSFISEPPFTSFDHLVGATEQRERHGKAERPGSLEVYDQLDFHNRQIGRLLSLENSPCIDADQGAEISDARPQEFGSQDSSPAVAGALQTRDVKTGALCLLTSPSGNVTSWQNSRHETVCRISPVTRISEHNRHELAMSLCRT